MNEFAKAGTGSPAGADGAPVAGLLGSVLLDQSQGLGTARPGNVPGSPPPAHGRYAISVFGGYCYAKRTLMNGKTVSGIGQTVVDAIADLEMNWRSP